MPRKSGTGCITCRIRRVKCDEARPHCRRCTASKRRCDGYLPESSTVTRRQLADSANQAGLGSVRSALSQSPQYLNRSPSPEIISVFDLFRHSTAPSTTFFFPSDFWTGGLLQLAHSEPAIWNAVIALGTLHRRWDLDTQTSSYGSRDTLTHQAIEHYGFAVSQAKGLNDPSKVLALCLALIAVANLLGNWDEGILHMTAGLRLLAHSRNNELTRSAEEVLIRQDLQAMTFSEHSAPYPFQEAEWLSQADMQLQGAGSIDSYAQATTSLFALMRRTLLFDETLSVLRQGEHGPRAQELLLDVSRFETRMSVLERNSPQGGRWAIAARLYHTTVRLLLSASAFGPETRWDQYLGHFERIISCVEVLMSSRSLGASVSLELGLIAPLFVVAGRCRHPYIRRRAVAILRRLRSQEGKWNSMAAAVVVERVIAMEEETDEFIPDEPRPASQSEAHILAVPWEAWATGVLHLPSQASWDVLRRITKVNRCRETIVSVSLEKRLVNLTMILCSGDMHGTHGKTKKDLLHF